MSAPNRASLHVAADIYGIRVCLSSLPLHQAHQRAVDVKKALDLLTLLNEGAAVHNMMEGNFSFKQFQVGR